MAGTLDLVSVAVHVATELERAAPAALSVSELAAGYRHLNPGDVSRVRAAMGNENASDAAVSAWLVERTLSKFPQVVESDGRWSFAERVTFDRLKFQGRKVKRKQAESNEVTDADVKAIRAKQAQPFFTVDVIGARGAMKEQQFRLHPLASSIPGMGDRDLLGFLQDVRAKGVTEPILVWGDEVLDGRHRLLAAYQLGVPVRVEKFTGTEDEARLRVWSSNVERRHLSVAQLGLLVREWFLPQAEEEAKQRLVTNPKSKKLPLLNLAEAAGTAPAIAVNRAGASISPATIRNMAPVDHAPITKQRIRNGEIKSASQARKEAEKEIGKPAPAPESRSPKSLYSRLGHILREANLILEGDAVSLNRASSTATAQQIRQRCDEVEKTVAAALEKVRADICGTVRDDQ